MIEAALKAAKAVVVLWSPRSVGSRWVRAEATMADRNKTLAPVIVEPCQRPIMFELTQTADLCHWEGQADDRVWRALVGDVRNLVGVRAAPQLPAAAPAPKDARPAIMVLPFINLGGDGEQEYFSDGVTEDIITDLGRISALSVVSRNTAFSYKGRTVSVSEMAAAQGVSHILEGSVRKAGERVRITAQLLETASDQQIWAERFDRTLDDIFAIQDEISQAIVAALKLKLAPAEQKALGERPTASAEAYELFLLARQFGRTGSERVKPLIVRLCQRAVDLDPGFGLAWAHMAFAEAEASQRSVPGCTSEHAIHAAERAMAVAPNLAEAHAAMAEAIWRGPKMNLEEGRPHIAKALGLDPDCFEAHVIAGFESIADRNWRGAVGHFEKACDLDPMAYRPAGMVTQAYVALGNQEDVLASARRVVARCERILAVEPDHSGALGFLVSAFVDLGEVDRAREWAKRAVLYDPTDLRMHYNLACGMASIPDPDAACDLLEAIIDKVDAGWLDWIDADNSLDPIRGNPRFEAIIARSRARFA
ncbi:MAG: Adenylate cyclase [Caulobacter sp.]|nr:Adenylate cyclase [Caulobacter sp.]